ncbi:MAG TPA: hypothetical protein VFL84_11830 [Gammaproteobacteria bacterium]|nr:hypothetical protein [Gammaproteobacteria bacterium]
MQSPEGDAAEESADSASAATAPIMTVNQLMRGILFPLGNTVFYAQADDPAAVPRDPMPSASTNPLTGIFGGWQAVENSALALVESAELLKVPGRMCSNGEVVDVANADWIRFVDDYRQKSLAAYEAVLTKDPDAIVLASGDLSEACLACHRVYRRELTQGDPSQRCIPGPAQTRG